LVDIEDDDIRAVALRELVDVLGRGVRDEVLPAGLRARADTMRGSSSLMRMTGRLEVAVAPITLVQSKRRSTW
jgi:hypothetical protein